MGSTGDETPSGRAVRTRVLVVDDEPGIRRAAVRILGQRFTVDSAAGATEALQLLEEHEFDVVITDNKMPTRSGLWLLRQLRERQPTIRRVMMSGTTVGDLHSHMKQGLVQVFLAKPFESERLLACVEVPESGQAPDLDAPDTATGGDHARPGTTPMDPRR